MSGRRLQSPGVLRVFATYVWNLCGAAAGPLAAGLWFGRSPGSEFWRPDGGTPIRGAAAAAAVAFAWTALGSWGDAGPWASVRRGVALGAASVGGAAGALIAAYVGGGVVLVSWFSGIDPLDEPPQTVESAVGTALGLFALVAGVLSSGRLWWLASRHAAAGRSLWIESATAAASAIATLAAAGGVRTLASPFAGAVATFVVVGAARIARTAELRGRPRRDEADVRPR